LDEHGSSQRQTERISRVNGNSRLCGAAPVAAQLQRGQLRLEVRDPAGAATAPTW
jgi:hypothetical protein